MSSNPHPLLLMRLWLPASPAFVRSVSLAVPPAFVPLASPLKSRSQVLALFVITVLVIGSALSILTGTLNEIRQVNSERSRKRRELRIFLQNRKVPTELLMRVMSYADYKMTRHSPVGYDPSLISPMLEAELATSQFGSVLNAHPLFSFISSSYPTVFAECCRALNKHFYCECEAVFCEGSLAEKMYVSNHGTFKLTAEVFAQDQVFFEDDCQCFAEISLYVEAVMHGYTLHTQSFSEVFSLTASDFARILGASPMCTTMVVEYANDYITRFSSASATSQVCVRDMIEQEQSCAKAACACNSFYLEVNVDSRLVLDTLDLSDLQSPVVKSITMGHILSGQQQDLDDSQTQTFQPAAQLRGAGEQFGGYLTPMDFVTSVVYSTEPAEDTLASLREAFVELDPDSGLHARFSDPKEQERAESAILSLVAIVRDDYNMPPSRFQNLFLFVTRTFPGRLPARFVCDIYRNMHDFTLVLSSGTRRCSHHKTA